MPPMPRPTAGGSLPAPEGGARPRDSFNCIARDGSRAAEFLLTEDETRVGSAVADGHVKLDRDPFIAPLHALFRFEGDRLVVLDAGTANGVFLFLKERKLNPRDELRI